VYVCVSQRERESERKGEMCVCAWARIHTYMFISPALSTHIYTRTHRADMPTSRQSCIRCTRYVCMRVCVSVCAVCARIHYARAHIHILYACTYARAHIHIHM
jgi:hypothetical protein